MTALQLILKEAKALRKSFPTRYKKWTDYVKQASAIYASKHKGKSPVGKKHAVKKKTAKKKVAKKKAVGKVDRKLKKGLASKGLKMPHGYDVVKRKRKISGIKRKPTEKAVLKSIKHAEKVQKAHMSGIKVGNIPAYKDKDAAREIQLFADNDYMLYQQRMRPILINLGKKYKKGTYDIHKAAKLFRYYIDAAMQKYQKEYGSRGDKWYDLLSVPDRNVLALDYAIETKNEFDLGNFTM
jgi:hypothetical protein